MNSLLKVLSAMKLADLPPVCRSFWDDDDEFANNFGCLDDDTKCDYIRDTFKKCLELSIRDDHNILRMCMLVIKGEDEDYEDEDVPTAETIQHVTIPVVQDTTELDGLRKENNALKQEIASLKQKTIVEARPELEDKPVSTEARGRGRPPKNPNASANKCVLCKIGFASSGSLWNHHKSKPHQEKVLHVLNTARPLITNEDKHYKIIVKVRSHCDDPNLTTEYPTPADIDNIKDYVADKVNPITDILLVEKPAGSPSWKNVC